MKKLFNILKEKLAPLSSKLQSLKSILPQKKPHSEKYYKRIAFLNKYSLIFHFLLACLLILAVETISRRDFVSAITFISNHTLAFLYNALIIFASLSLVYLTKYRTQMRILISGLWIFLGTVNGLILSNRVTPFSYTDLKCLPDLFAMQNTNYFTAEEATMVVAVVVAFFVILGLLFAKGPRYQGTRHTVLGPVSIAALILIGLPITTQAAQSSNILASYFANIAQGYSDYGFVYGFSTSVVGRGMDKPEDYSEETVDAINTLVDSASSPTTVSTGSEPNIICVLLESFCDPYEVNFLNMSEDPIPNFHNLEANYSTGYLTVPVVGAGTANTEFEVLTGMSMQYFGTGEYPYKTILKQTDCESIAADLSQIGYGTHVVHNNTATFYSRNNAFSMMGFDTFTSKELMNITEYTPLGSWPTDDILVDETIKSMDATPDQQDLVYTITVQGHGDYPTEKVIENPEITVSGAKDEATNNQWEYYINEIHEVDKFIGKLKDALAQRDEKTILVLWGDHLPTLGLEESDMATGDIFKTKYVTWNNFGLEKQDADLTSYQLLAHLTDQLDIHEGTMFRFHQSQQDVATDSKDYIQNFELLQYDILYGKRYCYNGDKDPYPASDLVMGIDETSIDRTWLASDGKLMIYGQHFTPWSKVFINGTKVPTTYVSGNYLKIKTDKLEDGDVLVVNQMGSSNTIFGSSNEYVYHIPADPSEETPATDTPQNETDIEDQDALMNNMDKNEVVNDIQEGTEEPVKQYPPATAKE